jgi:hypothetical protein
MPIELKGVIIGGLFLILVAVFGAELSTLFSKASGRFKLVIAAISVAVFVALLIVVVVVIPGGEDGPAPAPVESDTPTHASGRNGAVTAVPSSAVAAATAMPTPTLTAMATRTLTPAPTPTPTLPPMPTPVPTPTPSPSPIPTPALWVDQPQPGSKVGGVFEVAGHSSDLAGQEVYLVLRDRLPFPDSCTSPICPAFWMEFVVPVKTSGQFVSPAYACANGADYEVMLLYEVTDAGRAALKSWLWDTQSRKRAELPPASDVVVLGANLIVTADHSITLPPAGCSAAGAAD